MTMDKRWIVPNLPPLTGLILTVLVAAGCYRVLNALLAGLEGKAFPDMPLWFFYAVQNGLALPVSASLLSGLFLWAMLSPTGLGKSVLTSAGFTLLVLFCLFWLAIVFYGLHLVAVGQLLENYPPHSPSGNSPPGAGGD